MSSEPRNLTYPDGWLEDIEEALAHPERYKFVGIPDGDEEGDQYNVVIPSLLQEEYDRFNTRAVGHSISKGEHEAAALMNFYVVLKYKLWRAEHKRRVDYLAEVTNQPFSVAQSTIEHYCGHIEDLLTQGMPTRLILTSLGMAKGATARVAKLPEELLPAGGRQQLLETISNLAPAEAHRHLDDIEQRDVMSGVSGIHDSLNNRLILEVLVTHPMPQGAKDAFRDRHTVTCLDCPKEVALWMMESCHVKTTRREFR